MTRTASAILTVLAVALIVAASYYGGRHDAQRYPAPPADVQDAMRSGQNCWLEVKYAPAPNGGSSVWDTEWLCKP